MNDVMLRRCCIACDVLHKLDEGTIRAKHGYYVDPKLDDGCNVCAVGSLVVGITQDTSTVYSGTHERVHAIIDALRPYWGVSEAREIEAAFEGSPMLDWRNSGGGYTAREASAGLMFKLKHRTDSETPEYRIRSIMANILKNDGEFDVHTKVDPDGAPIEKCVACRTLVKA